MTDEMMPTEADSFRVGDKVAKSTGDYTFDGLVVARVVKRSGAVRWVVEDDRGLLFIFNQDQISLKEQK